MCIMFLKRNFSFILLACFILFTQEANSQFFINGTTVQTDSVCYQMTPDIPGSIASIWNEDQIDLNNSFNLKFNMNFGCQDIGADGMVFVLQTSPSQLGQSGGDIGYGPAFNPSIAIEFDTYKNDVNQDLDADHIAIIQNGIVAHSNPNNLAGPINASASTDDIEDCEFHRVRVTWDADSMLLEVYFDCILRLSYTGDIINNIFGGASMVYWGFTASTGGLTNVQSICFDTIETTRSGTNQAISICEGDTIQLNGSNPDVNYSWSPVDSLSNPNIINPMANPTENITYIGIGIDGCENEYIDTFEIVVNQLEIEYIIEPVFVDTIICEGETIDLTLQTDDNNSITWQDGTSNNAYSISQTGFYEVVLSNDCATTSVMMEVEAPNCSASMPNVFTPDSDGVNDFFVPVSEAAIEIIQFKIFNRWGEVVYDEINPTGWDGTKDDKIQPSDVYVYIVEFINGNGVREYLTGDVTLIR